MISEILFCSSLWNLREWLWLSSTKLLFIYFSATHSFRPFGHPSTQRLSPSYTLSDDTFPQHPYQCTGKISLKLLAWEPDGDVWEEGREAGREKATHLYGLWRWRIVAQVTQTDWRCHVLLNRRVCGLLTDNVGDATRFTDMELMWYLTPSRSKLIHIVSNTKFDITYKLELTHQMFPLYIK